MSHEPGRDRSNDHATDHSILPAGTFAYPVIRSCVGDGREPSAAEVETVAERMWREMAGEGNPKWEGIGLADHRRRRLLAAARIALTGRHVRAARLDLPRGH